MKSKRIKVEWPNGNCTIVEQGEDWLKIAIEAGVSIPTGCLGGSCGACEIEVNGEIIRACISRVSTKNTKNLKVEVVTDPYW